MPSQRTRVPVSCQHCGAPFEVQPYRVRDGTGKFCSRPCANAGGHRQRGPRDPLDVQFRRHAFTWVPHPTLSTPCLIWTGAAHRAASGALYGTMGFQRTSKLAHHVAWFLAYGVWPAHTIDHLCRVTLCVNVAHLDDVPNCVNILRGNAPAAVNARKTHCIRDHPFNEHNTHLRPSGRRQCRLCERIRSAQKRRHLAVTRH